MKKLSALVALFQLGWLIPVPIAQAAVTVANGPTILVAAPLLAPAASGPIALFKFSLNQDAGETLSGITVTITKGSGSNLSSSNLASLAVYKDNGDGNFNTVSDLLAGSQSTVNINAPTTITTGSNNAIGSGATFYVTVSTAATWSDTAPADSFTAQMAVNAVATSANSPTVIAVTTAMITADTTGPQLTNAVAQNTSGTIAKEAGDSVVLTFGEATNKPMINDGNINGTLTLNNGHSWLDGAGHIGMATWNLGGTVLTITLSSATSLPTVSTGDTVTIANAIIQDAVGNSTTGANVIGGNFGTLTPPPFTNCSNGLSQGHLYTVQGSTSIYVAVGCQLKLLGDTTILTSLSGYTVITPGKHQGDDERGEKEHKDKKLKIGKPPFGQAWGKTIGQRGHGKPRGRGKKD